MTRSTTNSIVIILIFFLFFFISLGLGYPVLNRYSPTSLDALSDSTYYANLVTHGLSGVSQDLRSTRLVLPLIAHGIYLLLPAKMGSWDLVSFSMLIVNALFCAMIGALIFLLGCRIFKDAIIAMIAALLFFLNFSISNFYLTGLIDSGFSFSLLILLYCLLNDKWSYLAPIALLGCLIKEAFLPIGGLLLFGWLVGDYYQTRKLSLNKWLSSALFVLLASSIVVVLRVWGAGQLKLPWQYMPAMATHLHYQGISLFYTIGRFLYVFVWLLPLAIPSIQRLPLKIVSALSVAMLGTLMLEWWVGASGAGFGRTLFDLAGPMLCLAAANTLVTMMRNYHDSH